MGAAHVLSKTEPGETLCVYLFVSIFAICSVLIIETHTIQ